jgi:acyl dehydratase
MGFNKGLGFEEIQEGDRLPEYRVQIDRETYFAYNKLINEINPLHFDKDYANKLGFRDIVVAGVYTFSFIPKMIEDWIGESGKICGIDIKYQNPIYIKETIIQDAHVKEKVKEDHKKYIKCEVSVHDMEGKELSSAVVIVDFS